MDQLCFDGLAIDVRQGRFGGTFDLDYAGDLTVSGGDIMFVVVARAKGASIDETTTGDIKRVDKLAVKQVAVVTNQTMREQLADNLGLELPAELALAWSQT